MIKKVMGVIGVVAVCAVAGWNYQQSEQSKGLSELALANIEALARYEDPNDARGHKMTDCVDNGRITGARCESRNPEDVCNYRLQWGDCK